MSLFSFNPLVLVHDLNHYGIFFFLNRWTNDKNTTDTVYIICDFYYSIKTDQTLMAKSL